MATVRDGGSGLPVDLTEVVLECANCGGSPRVLSAIEGTVEPCCGEMHLLIRQKCLEDPGKGNHASAATKAGLLEVSKAREGISGVRVMARSQERKIVEEEWQHWSQKALGSSEEEQRYYMACVHACIQILRRFSFEIDRQAEVQG